MSGGSSWMHLKPWSKAFSSAFCGCLLERDRDNAVRFIPCVDCTAALKEVQNRKRREMDRRQAAQDGVGGVPS